MASLGLDGGGVGILGESSLLMGLNLLVGPKLLVGLRLLVGP